jgi:penicillin-binding protein 2
LFVGFAPVQAPRYACAVVVEHGVGGSRVAAPLARDILRITQERNPAARAAKAPEAGAVPAGARGPSTAPNIEIKPPSTHPAKEPS